MIVAIVMITANTWGAGMMSMQPDGRFVNNATLRRLIREAYRLQDFQIVGGPAWVNFDAWTRSSNPQPQTISIS